MNEKKQYLIDEDTLREFLYSSHKLEILDRDGVDNWNWYMEGRTQYLAECASMLPWTEGRDIEDLMAQIENEDYYIDDLVTDQIDAFWEEHKEKCGNECQFKFKSKPTKSPVDNH